MDLNLVLATGLAYALLGALILIESHRALYRKADRIVAGYPKVLAALQCHRHDGRTGLTLIICGGLLQLLGAYGYSVSLTYWPAPAFFAAAVLCVYSANRLLAMRRISRAQNKPALVSVPARQVHETRRSIVLLEAARREAANLQARLVAREPRDRGVVYLAQEWECRWWSDRLGVSPDVLKAAVRQVGPMVEDIEQHLRVTSRRPEAVVA